MFIPCIQSWLYTNPKLASISWEISIHHRIYKPNRDLVQEMLDLDKLDGMRFSVECKLNVPFSVSSLTTQPPAW